MKLIVPHIPKCAGTLLRDLVTGENLSYPVLWFDPAAHSEDDFFETCVEPLRTLNDVVIGGHFTLRSFAGSFPHILHERDCLTLSVIRDPFERFCSHYEYHQRVKTSEDLTGLCEGISDPDLIGIYRSKLGVLSREIYSYYLGTGPYDPIDTRGVAHSVLTYQILAPTFADLLPSINLAIDSLSVIDGISIEPLTQLQNVLPEFSSVMVNSNPNGSAYKERYPLEYEKRLLMFRCDYIAYEFLRRMNRLLVES